MTPMSQQPGVGNKPACCQPGSSRGIAAGARSEAGAWGWAAATDSCAAFYRQVSQGRKLAGLWSDRRLARSVCWQALGGRDFVAGAVLRT